MYRGMIEEFETTQGTGTIRREDGKLFSFHISAVSDVKDKVLSQGAAVFFDIGRIIRGLGAVYVQVI